MWCLTTTATTTTTTADRFYGVFDGVSQCPESRIYAQTLAKETSAALKRSGDAGGSWSDQAQAALQQAAQAADRYSGASPCRKTRPAMAGPAPPTRLIGGPSWPKLAQALGSLRYDVGGASREPAGRKRRASVFWTHSG